MVTNTKKTENSQYLGNVIRIKGARQHNLKNLNIDIKTGEITVFTGVSGSGKSSLVFDTLYAEGQRRYVETFSPYARQFLDRMDKPDVDSIEGVLPAIAIDQANPVRTSRSTVGTMTEINDHLKLIYARAAHLHCRQCGQWVQQDTVATIKQSILHKAAAQNDPRLVVTFPVRVPAKFTAQEIEDFLSAQGYTRIHRETPIKKGRTVVEKLLDVVQDRFRVASVEESRFSDAVASALHRGKGKVNVFVLPETGEEGAEQEPWRFSEGLHCATCDLDYSSPLPSHFSFNSALGACDTCRGFGRVIGIDYGLVIPDENKSLEDGAVKPWTTDSFKSCQKDMVRFAKKRGIATDIAYKHLPEEHKLWVIEGDANFDGNWEGSLFYGVARYFEWLETRTYKMHVRVMLSKYRSYTPCGDCGGARLKPDSLLWKLPSDSGKHSIHDIMQMPLLNVAQLFKKLQLPGALDEASDLVLQEIRTRLGFLIQVGLGYLTLDRQSRTLSGGEVQRINLTTALGSSLVNTLFVLDEPSVGLHPRDIARVAQAMQRLKEAGNTLVVVEHDPQLMNQADRLVDIGPGPGQAGGNIVFDGAPANIEQATSLTARYLKGELKVVEQTQPLGDSAQHIALSGVRANNLKNIDFKLPLNRLVVLTGVSGSGKSTLVQDVLVPAIKKFKGEPTETPGEFDSLEGVEHIAQLAFVDQSPIGKTTRSNPASYVGAFDELRKLFAKTTIAVERDYKPGFFSFNSGDGRCPMCGGNGFEHVEMQFLSDVYLRCGECNGTRYRPEALEVTLERKGQVLNMAQVLELTVDQALDLFDKDPALLKALQPLAQVGLNYLRLGQPVPTLSGGEAQRLKLAGFLANLKPTASGQKVAQRGDLFVFDEPTTGLHFDDVAKLMRSLRLLQQAGHSVLIVEHNLDVICAADWLVDLGPEAGEYGGELVAQGTPEQLAKHKTSHTGIAIQQYLAQSNLLHAANFNASSQHVVEEAAAVYGVNTAHTKRGKTDGIEILHAREHNLKNISLTIPREKMTVITGPSGSGKSTLAFDILFSEGQRRYLESLNAYARQFVQPAAKPDVDAIFGIPPTVAIEQRTSRGGRKSTVATVTEVYHFLRLLFVKLGTQHCPTCEVPIAPQSTGSMLAQIMQHYKGQEITLLAPLVQGRKGIYNEIAKWAVDRGYERLRVDGEYVPTKPWPKLARYQEHHIEVPVTTLLVQAKTEQALRDALVQTLELGKGTVMVEAPEKKGAKPSIRFYSTKRACPSCARSFPELDPRLFSYNSKHGWCSSCFGVGEEVEGFDAETTGEEGKWLSEQDKSYDEAAENDEGKYLGNALRNNAVCGACNGQRLNPTALAVKFKNSNIAELANQTVSDALAWVDQLELDERQTAIAKDIRIEMAGRLKFLKQVGLDYLHLNRSAPTLSGGEAQRIRLASQLGTNLRGVCYVLDEPTIGLHTRDNHRLLDALETLRAKGNTLVIVEHDIDTMQRADRLVDIGPGAGKLGGEIISQGTVAEVTADPNSLTGRYLKTPIPHLLQPKRPVEKETPRLSIQGATLHNISGLNVDIPLGRLVAITGVSGSGKSTLARDIVLANMRQYVANQNKKGKPTHNWFACNAIEGAEQVARVLEVDQTPIGKTPRSCPATYIGFWNRIRNVLADTIEARMRGFAANRFSFNAGPGRCPVCDGQGMQTIEMNFLPDVKVVCEACRGKRFNPETLQVTWRDKTAAEILNMSCSEAAPFFEAHPAIAQALQLLNDVGLGYLTIGQPSPTLSGGEAQRIKLVTELVKVRENKAGVQMSPPTLYVLDEPTVGLHMNDVEKLIAVLHRLVDAGHTVVVIEHDLDLIAQADWVIDMGPEAGIGGGQLVAQGSPQELAKLKGKKAGHTTQALAAFYSVR